MPDDDNTKLVSTDWLRRRLNSPDIRVFDASWYLPADGREPRAEYEAAHIPGARFFDIDEISDSDSSLPHMVPQPEKFASRMRSMGVGDGHQVVVYDGAGLFSAARVWWLFRHMGKTDVAVLDGGFPKWVAEGLPVENLAPQTQSRHMTARRNAALVSDLPHVLATSKSGEAQIVDARSPDRFRGEAPEPRPGLRPGHIPGSRNVHFNDLLNPDGTLKPETELRKAFVGGGVDLSRPVITTCGSGITAAVLSLALEVLGHRSHSLYDGSWAEWGMSPDVPIETG